MTRKIHLFSILILFFGSCSTKFSDYESNWVVEKFSYQNQDMSNQVMMGNFTINPKSNYVKPLTFISNIKKIEKGEKSKAIFYRKDRVDYMEIQSDKILSGVFELQCIDSKCCQIVVKNKEFEIILSYNGGLSYEDSKRKCP